MINTIFPMHIITIATMIAIVNANGCYSSCAKLLGLELDVQELLVRRLRTLLKLAEASKNVAKSKKVLL